MKSKKYIIALIILIVLILISITTLIYLDTIKESEEQQQDIEEKTETYTDIIPVDTIYDAEEYEYYVINQYMSNFLNAIAFEDSISAYEMIDKTYAEENAITEENIISTLKFSDKYQEYETTELYYVQILEQNKAYFVYGNIREKNSEDGVKKELNAIINVDMANGTFSITPYLNEKLNHEEFDFETMRNKVKEIEKNDNNVFSTFMTNEKMKATKLFAKYISEALYYTDIAYESLDEEYRNLRFGSLEAYKQYISDNASFLQKLAVDSYAVTNKDEYTEYRIMDNYGNIYLFNVTTLLNYTAKLDEYTIPTQEFLESYNRGTIQDKVSLNIGKFFDMIDAKDYNGAYACLSDGFKSNYFSTVEEFKRYMQENFFESNKLEGVNFENEGEIYMITVKVTDYKQRDTKVIEKTFIMKLGEGTDFVMSFNME